MALDKMLSADDYSSKNMYNELKVLHENFHFEWKLNGFAEIPNITGFPVYSPAFCLANRSESVFQLLMVKELRLRKVNRSMQDEVPSTTEDVPMEVSDSENEEAIEIDEESNTEETPIDEKIALGFTIIKSEDSSTWEFLKYYVEVKIADIRRRTKEKIEVGFPYPENRVYQYIYEEDLNGIHLKEVDTICIEAFIEHEFLEPYPLEPASQFEDSQIADDLLELYKHPKFCDVILKTHDGEIPVNKCVLCTRSYHFDSYFQDSKNIPETKVKIDLDLIVLQAMLSYIYCGGIPAEFPLLKCLKLYQAAIEYRVPGLRLVIFQFLMKRKSAFLASPNCSNPKDFPYDKIKYSQSGVLEELGTKLITEMKRCKKIDFES